MSREDDLKTLGRQTAFTVAEAVLMTGLARPSLLVRLSRWEAAGKVVRLRRGLYAVAPAWRSAPLLGERVAALLREPAYLSGLWRMSHCGLIPESVHTYTCATTRCTRLFEVEGVGRFSFQTVKRDLFWGFREQRTKDGAVFLAEPEKALLDYLHLRPVEMNREELAAELRLQMIDGFDRAKLKAYATLYGSPRVVRMAEACASILAEDAEGWAPLPAIELDTKTPHALAALRDDVGG